MIKRKLNVFCTIKQWQIDRVIDGQIDEEEIKFKKKESKLCFFARMKRIN